MINQSKATQHAIAAVSRLAEAFHDWDVRLSAADIAKSRNLKKPVAAKILSILAQNGIVNGSPGPGGGYCLNRPPQEISLWDVVHLFEGDTPVACPYGPGWCGTHSPCPMHDSLAAMQSSIRAYLQATRFDVFVHHARSDPPTSGHAPSSPHRPARR
jgi:Rrf2 family protein